MNTDLFQPGDDVTVTWTSLKTQHTGRVIAPDHNLDMRGYLVEYDDMPGTRWIPEHGLQHRNPDGQTGATP